MSEAIKAKHYKELIIWQRAMQLVESVYRLTKAFPSDERYGLALQMRRAAVSIPSNIAEGQARRGTQEFVYFLRLASGSLAELETQLLLSIELNYVESASMPSRPQASWPRFSVWRRRFRRSWHLRTVASDEWRVTRENSLRPTG